MKKYQVVKIFKIWQKIIHAVTHSKVTDYMLNTLCCLQCWATDQVTVND